MATEVQYLRVVLGKILALRPYALRPCAFRPAQVLFVPKTDPFTPVLIHGAGQ